MAVVIGIVVPASGVATASQGTHFRLAGDFATVGVNCGVPWFVASLHVSVTAEGVYLYYDSGDLSTGPQVGEGFIPRSVFQGNVNTGMSLTVDTSTLEDFWLFGHDGGLVDVRWTPDLDGYRREFSGTETVWRSPYMPIYDSYALTGRSLETDALWEGTRRRV